MDDNSISFNDIDEQLIGELNNITLDNEDFKECFNKTVLISIDLYNKIKETIKKERRIKKIDNYLKSLTVKSIKLLKIYLKHLVNKIPELKSVLLNESYKILIKINFVPNTKITIENVPLNNLLMTINIVHSFALVNQRIINYNYKHKLNGNLSESENNLIGFVQYSKLVPEGIFRNDSLRLSIIPLTLFYMRSGKEIDIIKRYNNIFDDLLKKINEMKLSYLFYEEIKGIFCYSLIKNNNLRFMNFFVHFYDTILSQKHFRNVIEYITYYLDKFDYFENQYKEQKIIYLYNLIFKKFISEDKYNQYDNYFDKIIKESYSNDILFNIVNLMIIDSFFDNLIVFNPFEDSNLEEKIQSINLIFYNNYIKIKFIKNLFENVVLTTAPIKIVRNFFKYHFNIGNNERYNNNNIFTYFNNYINIKPKKIVFDQKRK